jgi:uncharacterized membrane-anchored protein YhcB (DUF1043 family)
MNNWIWLFIALVLGVIVGNILLLKQNAKMKLPKTKKNNNANWDDEDD